jgi:phosphopantothenoylcysteine decarboxylase/phosphopantothenate--cysteine ligase
MTATPPAKSEDVRLLIGVCGSVSAVAVPHILAWLPLSGFTGVVPRVVMTRMAGEIIGAGAVRPFTPYPVVTDWRDSDLAVPHIELAQWAEVVLVLSATANFLGKAAHGIADDLLTSVVLAARAPVIAVPSTNEAMLAKPAVQRNIAQLREDGVDVVEPKEGLVVADHGRGAGSMGDFRPIVTRALAKAIAARTAAPSTNGTPAKETATHAHP